MTSYGFVTTMNFLSTHCLVLCLFVFSFSNINNSMLFLMIIYQMVKIKIKISLNKPVKDWTGCRAIQGFVQSIPSSYDLTSSVDWQLFAAL